MKTTFADLGSAQDYEFHDKPVIVQSLALVASQQKEAWCELERAAGHAKASVPHMYEPLTLQSLAAFRAWQETEHAAQEAEDQIAKELVMAGELETPAPDVPRRVVWSCRDCGWVDSHSSSTFLQYCPECESTRLAPVNKHSWPQGA